MSSIGGITGGGGVVPSQPSSENWRLKNYNDMAYQNAYDMEQFAELIVRDFFGGNPPEDIQNALKDIKKDFIAVGTGAPPSESACEKLIKDTQNFLSLAEKNPHVPSWAIASLKQSLSDFKYWVDSGEPQG